MTVAEMKPRDLGDIVGETFEIYRRNFLKANSDCGYCRGDCVPFELGLVATACYD